MDQYHGNTILNKKLANYMLEKVKKGIYYFFEFSSIFFFLSFFDFNMRNSIIELAPTMKRFRVVCEPGVQHHL